MPLNSPWTNTLAFDIALLLENSGETVDEVLQRNRLTTEQLLVFQKDPVFLRTVKDYRQEIRSNGVTFKMKARAQAEELLHTSWVLIHSPDVSAAVKADLIKSTVKWGGLEPKNDTAVGVGEGGGGVLISINLGDKDVKATLTDDGRTLEHDSESDRSLVHGEGQERKAI